tara:strand:- start:662 stop:1024 length:363 start_codon:yes stop_codon:yes gene_type:complete
LPQDILAARDFRLAENEFQFFKTHNAAIGINGSNFPNISCTALRELGSSEDGAIGPKTLETVKAPKRVDIIEQVPIEREALYRSLSNFDTFGKGWLRHNDETRKQALAIRKLLPFGFNIC